MRGRPKLGVPHIIHKRFNVTLDPKTVSIAKKIGNGNLSDGLRIAIAKLISRDK